MLLVRSASTLVLWAAVGPAQTEPQFRDREEPGLATRHVVAGDFDRDGDVDLMMGAGLALYLLDNDGTGQFVRAPLLQEVTTALAAADFDGDRDLDAAIGTFSDVRLVRNLGGGTFRSQVLAPLPATPQDLIWFDVEQDGDPDLIYAPFLSDVVVQRNDGRFGFAMANGMLPSLPLTQALVAGDVDGDGFDDLFVASSNGDRLFLSTPTGFVEDSGRILGLPSLAAPKLADVDGDGDQDLLGLTVAGLVVFFNDGSGQFAPQRSLPPVPVSMGRFAVADLDGDRDLDVAGLAPGLVFSSATPFVSLLYNAGSGRFVDVTDRRYRILVEPSHEIAIADFDGDRDNDVYVGASVLGAIPLVDRLLINREVDLHVEPDVATGSQVRIDASRAPGFGVGWPLALVAVGTEVPPVWTQLGAVHLDARAVTLPPISLVGPGVGTHFEPVPQFPVLVGLEFVAQGVVIDVLGVSAPRLTGFGRVRVR